MLNCPLCDAPAKPFYQERYHQCSNCESVFLDPQFYLSPEEEKKRYQLHNNDVNDPAYQKFVRPIVDAVASRVKKGSSGLDFGSGPGPVTAKLLRELGYAVELYDPYFHNVPENLGKQYNFISCCEVIEHFHDPQKEFNLLKKLLKPGGILLCKTDLLTPRQDFGKWYYKNDPTHVFFYQLKGLDFIKTQKGFAKMEIDGRLICFTS
jgi:SAM-dependent methyltransferase